MSKLCPLPDGRGGARLFTTATYSQLYSFNCQLSWPFTFPNASSYIDYVISFSQSLLLLLLLGLKMPPFVTLAFHCRDCSDWNAALILLGFGLYFFSKNFTWPVPFLGSQDAALSHGPICILLWSFTYCFHNKTINSIIIYSLFDTRLTGTT